MFTKQINEWSVYILNGESGTRQLWSKYWFIFFKFKLGKAFCLVTKNSFCVIIGLIQTNEGGTFLSNIIHFT